MKTALRFKAAIVGSRFEDAAKQIKWILGSRHRSRNPEMSELFLEEKLLPRILQKVLRKDSNVVDVGCHIGSFISLALKYAPDGCHTLIEPVPSKCLILRSKFTRATVHQAAAADMTGTAIFEEDMIHSGFSRLRGEHASRSAIAYEVSVKRLDDIVSGNVYLLKFDVEGKELEAMKGTQTIIKRDRPYIIFECGAECSLHALGESRRRRLYDFITRDLGYRIFTFSDFLFEKGELGFDEFHKCGLYPFRAFNFVAGPSSEAPDSLRSPQPKNHC